MPRLTAPVERHLSGPFSSSGVMALTLAPLIDIIRIIRRDRLAVAGAIVLIFMVLIALLGPFLAPHAPFETLYFPDGRLARLAPPSYHFWLGTNSMGQDILSQLILGTRLAFIVGLSAAIISVTIGINVGLISGYSGGWLDQILMRITDVAFGIPFLPFALVVISLTGPSITHIILVIVLFIWCPKARVIRSQVLKLKEAPFTMAARAGGAGNARIMYVHIGPNILPLASLYLALSVAEAVLLEASLRFLGFGDPLVPTWGLMINSAFKAGAIRSAWWWVLPPGFALTAFIISLYTITRAYEEVVNPRLIAARRLSMALLEIQDLSIHYKTPQGLVRAVDGASFALEEGQYLGLVGESGCGKTTVAKAILRTLPGNAVVASGKVLFRGQDLLTLPFSELQRLRWKEISTIPQSAMNALDPVYRVGTQIVEVIRTHERMGKDEAMERIGALFEKVSLNRSLLHRYSHQFSGGMRQRVTIANALTLDPTLIVADEPTTGLDVIVQDQIFALIRSLQQSLDKAMLLITHDMPVVAENCRSVVIMYAGKAMAFGPTENVLARSFNPYTLGLQNAFPRLHEAAASLIAIPGAPPDLINPPRGCRFHGRCPFATPLCHGEEPPLVQVEPGHVSACHYTESIEEFRITAKSKETWERRADG